MKAALDRQKVANGRRVASHCRRDWIDTVKLNPDDALAQGMALRCDGLFLVDREAKKLGLTGVTTTIDAIAVNALGSLRIDSPMHGALSRVLFGCVDLLLTIAGSASAPVVWLCYSAVPSTAPGHAA